MFKDKLYIVWFALVIIISSCIGDDFIDDFVEPEIRIINAIDTLEIGTSYQLEVDVFNNVGIKDNNLPTTWASALPEIVSVSDQGLATALSLGQATLTATVSTSDGTYSQDIDIVVGMSTSITAITKRKGIIKTTSSYELKGDFTLEENNGTLVLSIADNYKATAALPGLFVYLSNNPKSIAGAHEIAAVKIFTGAHQYEITGVDITAFNYLLYYCKPFNVKVGDAEIIDAE